MPQLPVLSVPAAPRLTFQTLQKLEAKLNGRSDASGSSYTVTFGGNVSESFTCPGHDCEPVDNWGSIITGTINSNMHLYTQVAVVLKWFIGLRILTSIMVTM